jgi:uncharacterized damage-inducible protein DinB
MNTRNLLIGMLLVLVCAGTALAQTNAGEHRTAAQVIDSRISGVEKEFVSAAEAMPEDKYSFAPTSGEFKGVRTFGQQVKHVAASNYEFGAAIIGEKPPIDVSGESGPADIKSKAEIVKFAKDSFTYLHKAIASINANNMIEPMKNPWGGKEPVTRLGIAVLAAQHPFDHYGQMVVYLRMNGIVPPASR